MSGFSQDFLLGVGKTVARGAMFLRGDWEVCSNLHVYMVDTGTVVTPYNEQTSLHSFDRTDY